MQRKNIAQLNRCLRRIPSRSRGLTLPDGYRCPALRASATLVARQVVAALTAVARKGAAVLIPQIGSDEEQDRKRYPQGDVNVMPCDMGSNRANICRAPRCDSHVDAQRALGEHGMQT